MHTYISQRIIADWCLVPRRLTINQANTVAVSLYRCFGSIHPALNIYWMIILCSQSCADIMVFWDVTLCTLVQSSTMEMKAAGSSKTFVYIYQTTWCHIPVDCAVNSSDIIKILLLRYDHI
jgi:hypothetical protein